MDNQTQQICTFTLGNLHFGMSVELIQEVLKSQPTTPVPLAPKDIAGLINLRSQILTVINLHEVLQIERDESAPRLLLVLRSQQSPISFEIDKIGDVLTIDPKRLENCPETTSSVVSDLVKSAYVDEEQLLLILNTPRLVKLVNDRVKETQKRNLLEQANR